MAAGPFSKRGAAKHGTKAFLETVVQRCELEAVELGRAKLQPCNSEPARVCLMGMAGAGLVMWILCEHPPEL